MTADESEEVRLQVVVGRRPQYCQGMRAVILPSARRVLDSLY